jgi:hypothetical protein
VSQQEFESETTTRLFREQKAARAADRLARKEQRAKNAAIVKAFFEKQFDAAGLPLSEYAAEQVAKAEHRSYQHSDEEPDKYQQELNHQAYHNND